MKDHARAIDVIFYKGANGDTYNIGVHNEWKNLDLVHLLCDVMDQKLGNEAGISSQLITFVTDRAVHVLRYAIDATKLEDELGWVPSVTFEQGLDYTGEWYLYNWNWIEQITSGSYQSYYKQMYQER